MKFRAQQRIKRALDFSNNRTEGQRIVCGSFFVQGVVGESGKQAPTESRLGVVASRRVGNAVIRARAKRLMREIYRKHAPGFQLPVDMVMVARPHLLKKSFADSEQDFRYACHQLGLFKVKTDSGSAEDA